MRSSDRPPLANEPSCDHDRNNDEEDFMRKMSQPLQPEWNYLSDQPCLCIASFIEPEIIAVHLEPLGPVWHMLECQLCCHVWIKIEQTDSDCTDNPAKK